MTAAVLMLHQQEAITCADGFAFTGGIDGLLARCSSLCVSAVLAARAVSVTVKKSINPTFDSFVLVVVFSKNPLWIHLLDFIPALCVTFELASGGAAGVIIEVEKPRVTIFPSLHSGVSTDFTVPLFEAQRCLVT